eukprot:48400-Chlamydomonas_euryale.AAC.3
MGWDGTHQKRPIGEEAEEGQGADSAPFYAVRRSGRRLRAPERVSQADSSERDARGARVSTWSEREKPYKLNRP